MLPPVAGIEVPRVDFGVLFRLKLQHLIASILFSDYTISTLLLHTVYQLWQYGFWSFQTRGTKLERFLPKNQHTQRKLLNFENWISGGLRSFKKSEF